MQGVLGHHGWMTEDKKQRDWDGFDRCLSRGFTVEEAAKMAVIPLTEAIEHSRGIVPEDQLTALEMKRTGSKAIRDSVRFLRKVMKKGPRVAYFDGGETPHNVDVDAAKTLLRFGLDAVKLSQFSEKKGQGRGPDALEMDEETLYGPWVLKRPGA